MRVLVTGGAGFIGSHLCDRLVRAGHSVVAYDDLSRGRADFLAGVSGRDSFRFVVADLLDSSVLDDTLRDGRFDAVVHLAANSDIAAGSADRRVDLDRTFLTTWAVAEGAARFGIRQLVFASTSAVYGEVEGPTGEDFAPMRPISYYGAAKLAGEAWLSAVAHRSDVSTWVFRFPNVVGERGTHGVLVDFIARLRVSPSELVVLGDGQQQKPYLYVHDLLDGIQFAWSRAKPDPLVVFNLGPDGPSTKVFRIAEIVVEEMGLNAAIRYGSEDRGWPGDVPRFQYELSRIHALGWSARLSSDDAVRRAVRALLGKSVPPWK